MTTGWIVQSAVVALAILAAVRALRGRPPALREALLLVDGPIERYCPAFPTKPWPVTARQLLRHLAGVRHYTKPRESGGTQHYLTVT